MSVVSTAPIARIRALDLFAGTGWGVACKWLGIAERGVEIMEEAVQTRAANGMETIYRDVWDGLQMTAEEHRTRYGSYGLLIASPPCQTFSLAGHGAGRAAMDEVLEAIDVHAYKDADALREFGEKHDMRTALVLSPLAYVWRDRPRLVVMEQVPTVLPVWEACAEVMRSWGYDVKVEVLNAEQYGVPQTRRRAILVARRGGAVHLPVPSHSRYHAKDPGRMDQGVLPWVSMAEALGWGMTDRPMPTITGGVHGPTDRWASGGNSVRKMIDAKIGGPDWINPETMPEADGRTQYGMRLDVAEVSALQSYPPYEVPVFQSGHRPNASRRPVTEPAPTIIAGNDTANRGFLDESARGVRTLSLEEAAALQSYPATRGWGHTDRPSPTIMGGAKGASGVEIWDRGQRDMALAKIQDGTFIPNGRVVNPDTKLDPLRMTPEEAARLQSYPPFPEGTVSFTQNNRLAHQSRRSMEQPAPTVTAGHDSSNRGFLDAEDNLTMAAPEQVAVLQSYPVAPEFVWCGSKSKKFLQIGNAVPPVLAEAVLAAVIGIRPGR